MPLDLFCESSCPIQCILENIIQAITLVDTCTTRYGFIDENFAEYVCQVLQIKTQRLIKPKPIQGFDGKVTKPITYAIYPTLTIGNYTKSLTLVLMTKLGIHPMILCRPQMKKHGVYINMINDSITFWPEHYIHIGALPLSNSIEPITITKVRPPIDLQENIPKKILRWGLRENIDE